MVDKKPHNPSLRRASHSCAVAAQSTVRSHAIDDAMPFRRVSNWCLCALLIRCRALAPLRLVVRTCGACATAKFDAQQALDGLAKSSENAEVTSGACDGECAGPSVSVEIDGEPAVSLRRPRSPPNLISSDARCALRSRRWRACGV